MTQIDTRASHGPVATTSVRPGSPARLVRSEASLAILVFAILFAIPLLYEGYAIYILPQYMLFGVMAMSLALLWGYTGVLSFGQAGFFAVGGYIMGLLMSAALPVNPAYLALVVAASAGACIAALIGWFLFSAGVRDAYFVLVTLALSIVIEQLSVSQSQITGGWNGLFVMRPSLTFGIGEISLFEDRPIYYVILVFTALIYFGLSAAVRSRFGKILIGIRENEPRMEALGFETSLYKTAAFALSGSVACLAGALYGAHSGFISPSLGGVLFSTEVVVWVAIAGRSSLLAGLLGGIIVSSLSNALSAVTPEYWQLIIGVLFIVSIAWFQGGVAGAVSDFLEKRGDPR
jgi:urea ABC transporter permease protein UrtC